MAKRKKKRPGQTLPSPNYIEIPGPPRDFQALLDWLGRYGDLAWLNMPIEVLDPWLGASSSWMLRQVGQRTSLRNCLKSKTTRNSRLYQIHQSLAGASLQHLAFLANHRSKRLEWEASWSRPLQSEHLETAAARMKAFLAEVLQCDQALGPVFTKGMQVAFQEVPACVVFIHPDKTMGPEWQADETRLELESLGEETPIWSCTLDRGHQPCSHLRMILEWTLGWLYDPDSQFHDHLVALLSEDPWKRLVDRARLVIQETGDARGDTDQEPSPGDRELAWRVGRREYLDGFEVMPVIRTRGKNGRFGRGRREQPTTILEEPGLLDPQDEQALSALLRVPFVPRNACILKDELIIDPVGQALEALVGHPRVFRLDKPLTALKVERAQPTIEFRQTDDGRRLCLRLGHHRCRIQSFGDLLQGRAHLIALDEEGETCWVARIDNRNRDLLALLSGYRGPIPDENLPELLEVLALAQPGIALDLPRDLSSDKRPADGTCRLRLAPLGEAGLEAWLRVRPLLDGPSYPPGTGPNMVLARLEGGLIQAVRQPAVERRTAGEIQLRLGLGQAHTPDSWHWRLGNPEEALGLLGAATELSDALEVEWPEDVRPWRVARPSAQNVRVRVRREHDWFRLDGDLEVDGEKLALNDLLARVQGGERFVRLGPGRFALLSRGLRKRLKTVAKATFDLGRGKRGAGAGTAARLKESLGDLPVEADNNWHKLLSRIDKAGKLRPRIPKDLKVELRDYQIEGLRWIARLAAWTGGACLADEMGLGKTVQALALLLRRKTDGPALVVAPSSVGSVWLGEAARFAPSLALLHYHGPDRRGLLEDLGPGDLLITSYDVLARDADTLAELKFSTLVLDESQYVKNARSKRAKAVVRIQAGFRLALTGTPLENHLGELWSMFRAVDPGLLGPWEHFRERYAAPIERDGDLDRRDELALLLRPFLLRRTKLQVAPELPPRTEVIRPVEMSKAERSLYQKIQQEAIEALANRDDAEDKRFVLLAVITRLRRLACHPRLLTPDSRVGSSKLAAAKALIDDLLHQNQRALVFSQFTSHLALLREVLDEKEIPYLYLDGSTPLKKRAKLVESWATGEPALFLISLKAGGFGLNLTGADMVIHMDPWWNPAVEDQASDRTHRIGQTRPVTVVRLIVQDTIEQAVLDLHRAKRELARGLLQGAEAAGKLSPNELMELVRFGQQARSQEGDGARDRRSQPYKDTETGQ